MGGKRQGRCRAMACDPARRHSGRRIQPMVHRDKATPRCRRTGCIRSTGCQPIISTKITARSVLPLCKGTDDHSAQFANRSPKGTGSLITGTVGNRHQPVPAGSGADSSRYRVTGHRTHIRRPVSPWRSPTVGLVPMSRIASDQIARTIWVGRRQADVVARIQAV